MTAPVGSSTTAVGHRVDARFHQLPTRLTETQVSVLIRLLQSAASRRGADTVGTFPVTTAIGVSANFSPCPVLKPYLR